MIRSSISVAAAWWMSIVIAVGGARAADDPMLVGGGETMGSTYMVKVYDPPKGFPEDWQLRVDAELRLITDQMSTYTDNSEISRFNASTSLDWFEVSRDLAMVVLRAHEVSELSDGAFDITVAPLVKAWSFGPSKKRNVPPTEDEIASLRPLVGYDNVEARLEPPGLKKKIPSVTIELNAIAPGHGADRLVNLLGSLGAENLFVEVGGEVRVTGDKGGQPWTVGIQQPDVEGQVVAVAYPLKDQAVATSGDYRSFFEYEGKRYSHTIDPRTARPVIHNLASVTVLADDCMTADAMATTLSVLGEVDGLKFANDHGIDALIMVRGLDGKIVKSATGDFKSVIVGSDKTVASNVSEKQDFLAQFLPIAAICFVAFLGVIAAMAVGVMFGRRSISGSCGGLANKREPDGSISCALCSNPDNACKELRDRMQKS